MPHLVINHPQGAPELRPLRRLRLTIGRAARNDVCVPDPFASRIHAEVRFENDSYVLRDLGSANGTFYNGAAIEDALELLPGTIVRIGETAIELRDDTHTRTLSPADDPASLAYTLAAPSSDRAPDGAATRSVSKLTTSSLTDDLDRNLIESDLLALIGKVGVTLLAPATLDETLASVAALVFDAVPAERCVVMLRRTDGSDHTPDADPVDDLEVRAAMERRKGTPAPVDTSTDESEIKVSRSVLREVVEGAGSVLATDAENDPRFAGSTVTLTGVRSVLAVPLRAGTEVIGVIYADSPAAAVRFTESHLKVLTTLASVAAIRVQNARLVEQQFERERLARELDLAREIQQRFQPLAPPVVPGYDLLGISFSCYEIGGDYYDFITCPDGRLVVALGDVSGKGTSAALLMSSVHAAVHAQVTSQCSPVDVVRAVNKYLAATIPSNRFVTLFYAELDPATGRMSYTNAGHNPPLVVRRSGAIEQLPAGGLPLGILADAEHDAGATHLDPGDALVIYSDGVTETADPAGEEFGIDRLGQTILRHLDRTAAGLRDRIEAAVTQFADGTAAADDITLVIVKRAG